MLHRLTGLVLAMVALLMASMMAGCSGSDAPSPKKTVIGLFAAMENDDQAALTYVLDLEELMKNINEDYALQTDSARMFTDPRQILDDLTGEGLTKKTWFSLQRIIAEERITSETTATVTVSFVNKEKSKGYLTRFGLHKVNGKWKIYSFKTIGDPGR